MFVIICLISCLVVNAVGALYLELQSMDRENFV